MTSVCNKMRLISASRRKLVGVIGFEPTTPSSRTRCSTRLSHTPTDDAAYTVGIPDPQAAGTLSEHDLVRKPESHFSGSCSYRSMILSENRKTTFRDHALGACME